MSQLGCDNVLCLDSLQKAITIHRHTPSARPSFNDKQELQPTLRESPSLSQVSTLGIFKTMSMLYEVELAIRTLVHMPIGRPSTCYHFSDRSITTEHLSLPQERKNHLASSHLSSWETLWGTKSSKEGLWRLLPSSFRRTVRMHNFQPLNCTK